MSVCPEHRKERSKRLIDPSTRLFRCGFRQTDVSQTALSMDIKQQQSKDTANDIVLGSSSSCMSS
jgi:hypothetical protein